MELASTLTADLCKRFEGFKSRPYLCPAGVPTIGYGSTYYSPGKPVTLSDSAITKQEAEELLVRQIDSIYLPGVLKLCPNLRNYPYKLAAITDYAYNLGVTRLKSSTLRKRIKEEKWDQVCIELRKWVRGGGVILPGLVARREAEVKLVQLSQNSL